MAFFPAALLELASRFAFLSVSLLSSLSLGSVPDLSHDLSFLFMGFFHLLHHPYSSWQ